MTVATWIMTMVAIVAIVVSIFLGMRSQYFEHQAGISEQNHEAIIHINDEITQMMQEIKSLYDPPAAKVRRP